MPENGNGVKTITEIIDDGVTVKAAFDKAFYRAVLLHRQANVPMVFSENGKPVEVDAKEIPIPEKYADLEALSLLTTEIAGKWQLRNILFSAAAHWDKLGHPAP